jgi:hypothetical protein
MDSYQLTSTQTNQPAKWQARIEKRRNERGDVLGYVDQIIRDNKVPVDDVAAFLTAEELQEINYRVAYRAKQEAAAKAQNEADRLKREIRVEENDRQRAAFWKCNPPSPLTAAPDIETESALFDVLSRYHIVKVRYSFYSVNYHWERFQNIENPTIEAWLGPRGGTLPSDIGVDLMDDELPGDEDGRIGNAIYEAIEQLASDRAMVATNEGKLQEGTVTFDVRDRCIKLEAVVEVTRDEDFTKEWAPDDET